MNNETDQTTQPTQPTQELSDQTTNQEAESDQQSEQLDKTKLQYCYSLVHQIQSGIYDKWLH